MLLLFFSGFSLIANPTDKNNKTKEESKNTTSKKPTEKEVTEDDESFFVMEQKTSEVEIYKSKSTVNTDDPDSSYYSVNKFNYLFYYLYKVKYLGIEEEIELEP